MAVAINERIYRHLCDKCERPALTFDQKERPLCARHATIFIAAPRIDADDEEEW